MDTIKFSNDYECASPDQLGHVWRARGFFSDECIYCGTIAVDGINGTAKDREACPVLVQKEAANKRAYMAD